MKGLKAERGFALIAALLANLILLAVGIFAINLSTADIRISTRLVGDRKAFNAAESGMNWLVLNLDDPTIDANRAAVQVTDRKVRDADSSIVFTIGPLINPPQGAQPMLLRPGYPMIGQQRWGQKRVDTTVTGKNTSHNTEASHDISVAWGPVPMETAYQ